MGSWLTAAVSASIHRGCRMEESLCLLWQALVICLQQERRFVQEEASQETTVHRLKGGGGFQGVMQVQKKRGDADEAVQSPGASADAC